MSVKTKIRIELRENNQEPTSETYSINENGLHSTLKVLYERIRDDGYSDRAVLSEIVFQWENLDYDVVIDDLEIMVKSLETLDVRIMNELKYITRNNTTSFPDWADVAVL